MMAGQITDADADRIRRIMVALVSRDEQQLDALVHENPEDIRKVWEFIESLNFEIAAPLADFEQWIDIYPADGGLCVDARFPTAEGEASDLFVMIDIITNVQPHKFILKGVTT